MDLTTAIAAAEQGKIAYTSAINQKATDQTVVDGINTKLTAAQQVVAGDNTNITTTASTYLQNLKDLDAAVQAEITGLTPPPPTP